MEVKTKKKRIRKVDKRTITVINPKQKLFYDLYTNPKSPSFSNAYRSAINAGFKEEYAKTIIHKEHKWLSKLASQLTDEKMLLKAEENFREVQDLAIKDNDGKVDTNIIAQRNKVDMFLAERLNKVKYSTRTENAVLVKVEHTIDEETKKRLDALL